jgi:hypothetical protein
LFKFLLFVGRGGGEKVHRLGKKILLRVWKTCGLPWGWSGHASLAPERTPAQVASRAAARKCAFRVMSFLPPQQRALKVGRVSGAKGLTVSGAGAHAPRDG